MKIPPYVSGATSIKKKTESSGALTGIVRRIRSTQVKGPIENTIEIPRKQGRDQGINFEMEVFKEEVPSRVAVRGIQTYNTKDLIAERKFTLEITTHIITPRTNQRQ